MDHSQRRGPACSFCGKLRDEVHKLIAGPAVYICNECVGLCDDLLDEEEERVPEIAALGTMNVAEFLRERLAGRPADSITVREFQLALVSERKRRLPKPAEPTATT